MIHLVRPSVPTVGITIHLKVVNFLNILNSGTDVQTPRMKIVITTSRDCG